MLLTKSIVQHMNSAMVPARLRRLFHGAFQPPSSIILLFRHSIAIRQVRNAASPLLPRQYSHAKKSISEEFEQSLPLPYERLPRYYMAILTGAKVAGGRYGFQDSSR